MTMTICTDENLSHKIDSIDAFVCDREALNDLIADAAGHPYALGWLEGIMAFRQQLAIITCRPF